jgi:hypothetical protein
MARFKYQGVWTDGNGRRIDSATVSAYLAGTDTAASVYTASSGGAAVNSVTTDTSGLYEFWVDDTNYTQEQLFKITMSKTNFQSKTIDDIEIFKSNRMILKGDNNFFIDGRTDPRTITLGAERQEHTAGVAGTRAKHIDVKPAGFDDTSGIVIVQDLDGSSSEIRVKGLNFNADISGATNAHVNAIEVSKVGDLGSGMQMDALDVRAGIGVIDHHSGSVVATDTAFKYDDSGASYTDVTTEFGSAGSDVSIFDENSDYIYIGDASQFNTIEVILATGASKSIKTIFEYSQGGSSWNALPVSDDTNGFRENGNIFYSIPGDWATDTVNAIASKYWVRMQRNNNNVPIVPIEDTIKVLASTDFIWDKDGNLTINDITANDITANDVSGAAITSSGVMTANSLQIDDTTGDHQYVFTVNELSADRSVDLPLLASDDEVVMKDHAVVLSNKSLQDNTCQFVDNGDNTKKLAFECSGITTGNTRTVTMPDADTIFDFGIYMASAGNIVNLDGTPGSHTAKYMRVGNMVTVSGMLSIDPTTTTTLTKFTLSLPIASNFTGLVDLAGAANKLDATATVVDAFMVIADLTNDLAEFYGFPIGVGNDTISYTYTYQIK